MVLADSHTHLYLEEFDDDREQVIARALNNGVCYMFLPNIDSGSIQQMLALSERFPDHCFPMIGLHPTSVKANFHEELATVLGHLENHRKKFFGIGEIGIDLYWDKTFYHEQLSALSAQLDLGIKYDLPVIIHTRNSFDLAIDAIRKKNSSSLKGIFHCFGGNFQQAKEAVDAGFKLGIGGIITYKNSGLQKVVEAIGLEHLVLETDAPFLPPVPHRGQRNEPSYIPLIAGKVAEIKNMTIEKVAEITTRNVLSLFQLS